MTDPSPMLTELRGLLDALCEEAITPEQVLHLEKLVLEHPEAEGLYVQTMGMQADLGRHFGAHPDQAERSVREKVGIAGPETAREPAKSPKRLPRIGRKSLWMGSASLVGLAAAVLLMVTIWPRPQIGAPPAAPSQEITDNTVALLRNAPGAQWEESGLHLRAGASLAPGWLRLKSGVAQIEFYSGAVVILEGPAEFRLISRMEAFCARGKLRATVPPQAQGFAIGSPNLNLVDRGTEFGLTVGEKTEVHVFEGKVELFDPDPEGKPLLRPELTTGQSIRLEGPGQLETIKQNPGGFLTAKGLAARSRAEVRRRQEDWRKASKELRDDPDLLVYFPFETEEPWSGTLANQTSGPMKSQDGAIVGCSWVAGRWQGKQGLEFKRVGDRVRFHVPGSYDSLTMMAWVRVDSLPNRFNSLMMTDAWDEGEAHWHIGYQGTLELGVQGPKKKKNAHYEAPEVISPDLLGQWIQLAVVYDKAAGRVTHYVDGRLVGQVPILFDVPLRVGDVELGNWNLATHKGNDSPVRNFNGAMDEFLLFSRALTDDEIEGLYTVGQPPG